MEKKLNRREFLKASAATGAILHLASNISFAEAQQPVELLKPQSSSANPIIRLLWQRQSSREFSPEQLPLEVLSAMLWAAFGVNRPDGRRTAPTARNQQEIDIYVSTVSGLYRYEPKAHLLSPILAEDTRGLTGRQPFVKEAPVNLIYVADYSRMGASINEDKDLYSSAATGFISQNVYLYCASEGLATVVRALIDKSALARVMKLRPDQRIILAQSVGYPKKKS